MPYGQKKGKGFISIDIYALRAKEKTITGKRKNKIETVSKCCILRYELNFLV